MSTLLGLVVDVIQEQLNDLKVGKTVREVGHTVLLGWSDRAPLIIAELILANESEGGGVVVVLAEAPSKEVIEADVAHRFGGKMRGTRVVVRNGSPMLRQDLLKVGVESAKCAMVLSETTGDADKSDALSLRKVLTVKSLEATLQGFVLVEIRDVDNEPLVKLVGGDAVETLVSHDIIGRMMVMGSRNPGLSRVYSQVLGFEGDEFYMAEFPELAGLPFADLQARFPDAVPIGLASSDGASITLKPDVRRVVRPGEKVVVLAEDDDTFAPTPWPAETQLAPPPRVPSFTRQPELILFCGWRRDIRDVLLHLDQLVAPGSEVHMCTDAIPLHQRDVALCDEGLDSHQLENLTIKHFNVNTSIRRRIDELPLEDYTSVMVFPDQAHETDMMRSDSHAISTLLLVRDVQQKRRRATIQHSISGRHKNPLTVDSIAAGVAKWRSSVLGARCPMICEILDPRTQATVEANDSVAGASDFMQTNKLIAQVLAMISENRGVKHLLSELLAADGASFTVVPSRYYVGKNEALDFFALARRCFESGATHEILVGYQDSKTLETVINPRDKRRRKRWDHTDLVVLKGVSRLGGEDRERAASAVDSMMSKDHARPGKNVSALHERFENTRLLQGSSLRGGMRATSWGRGPRPPPKHPSSSSSQRSGSFQSIDGPSADGVILHEEPPSLASRLADLSTEDLNQLLLMAHHEAYSRNMAHIAPQNVPLDPTLLGLLENIRKRAA